MTDTVKLLDYDTLHTIFARSDPGRTPPGANTVVGIQREAFKLNHSALTARVAELEAALKPFAKFAKVNDDAISQCGNPLEDDRFVILVVSDDDESKILVGDLRRAAALLAKGE